MDIALSFQSSHLVHETLVLFCQSAIAVNFASSWALSPQLCHLRPKQPLPVTQVFSASTHARPAQCFFWSSLSHLSEKKHYPLFKVLQQLSPNKFSLKTIFSFNLSKFSYIFKIGIELRSVFLTTPFAGTALMFYQIHSYKMHRYFEPIVLFQPLRIQWRLM